MTFGGNQIPPLRSTSVGMTIGEGRNDNWRGWMIDKKGIV